MINKEGTFPWETYQCDISDKLNHPNFKFRIRAHGTYAYDIGYWHVDNIKEWNPEWSSATIHVRNGAEQVSESQVKLTGAHGGCYEGATDLSGTWMIPAIETGRYEISVIKDGYNDYKDSIDVQSSTNGIQIPITAPRIQMEFNQIEKELKQEEIDQTTVKMSNTGNGPVYWKLQPNYAPRSGDESAFFSNAELFNAGGDLQNGVIFDGENYYSSSWYFMEIGRAHV